MMLSKTKLLQAQHDFAAFYMNILHVANATYQQGHENIKLSVQVIEQDLNQIKHAQAWSVTHLNASKQVAQMCSSFGRVDMTLMEIFQDTHEQIAWWQTALKAACEVGDAPSQAYHLLQLAALQMRLTQYKTAIELYDQALELTVDEPSIFVKAFNGLGDIHHRMGEFDRAQSYYEHTISVTTLQTLPREAAAAYAGLGNIHKATNQFDSCKMYYQKSIDLYRDLGDQLQLSIVQSLLGEVYYAMGSYKEAETLQLESLQTAEAVGYKRGTSYALRNLGYIASETGRLETAFHHFEQALEISRRLVDLQEVAILLHGLASVREAQTDYSAAKALLMECNQICEESGDQTGIAMTCVKLGDMATGEREFVDAFAAYQRALRVFQTLGDQWGCALCQSRLGENHLSRGQFSEANACFDDTLSICDQIGDPRGRIIALVGLGHIQLETSRLDTAETHFRQAFAQALAIDMLPMALRALIGLAKMRCEQGDHEAGLEYLGLVQSHPAVNSQIQQESETLLNQVRMWRPTVQIDLCLQRGRSQTLQDLMLS